jgi:hypothetical protein
MSGKGRSLSALQKVKDHFFESCKMLGHPENSRRRSIARLKVSQDILSAKHIPRVTRWKVTKAFI